ncbi:MAG: single-stranded DNA-binding protein [Blautia hansenii]|jgi:Single-stranded DNA-binding protein
MATHNQVRLVGFLKNNPQIINPDQEGETKILFLLRTIHREIDGYHGMQFQDLMVYYDGTELMPKMMNLTQFDLIDIKGVFNILSLNKLSTCSGCGNKNIKYNGTSTFVYPIAVTKLNGMQSAYEHDVELPERILEKHFKEVSNQALIIGTVVSEPEMVMVENGKFPCCRYRLGVDRKYYIKTQGDITADYPWVYSYAQQAERDFTHLKKGTLILVDGFIQNRKIKSRMICQTCGKEYLFDDAATEFVPYAIEYLSDYVTDEEIAMNERRQLLEMNNKI